MSIAWGNMKLPVFKLTIITNEILQVKFIKLSDYNQKNAAMKIAILLMSMQLTAVMYLSQ